MIKFTCGGYHFWEDREGYWNVTKEGDKRKPHFAYQLISIAQAKCIPIFSLPQQYWKE